MMKISLIHSFKSFRPQQGLTIMNFIYKIGGWSYVKNISFRPQQGLTIMNNINKQ